MKMEVFFRRQQHAFASCKVLLFSKQNYFGAAGQFLRCDPDFHFCYIIKLKEERKVQLLLKKKKKILGFKHFPVFRPAVRVCSPQGTDNAQNYSTKQHVLHLSTFSLAPLRDCEGPHHPSSGKSGGRQQLKAGRHNKVPLRVSLA